MQKKKLPGATGSAPRAIGTFGGVLAGKKSPWKPQNPEEEVRLEALRAHVPALREALERLRETKSVLANCVTDARRAGTRQDRADVLESRLGLLENAQVKEVEWVITDYSELLERCPKGQCIVSHSFCAAGISNIQLVFHPNGNKDASDGFCSIALRVPDAMRLSRVLFVNLENHGPDLVKLPCEGYSDACKVSPPSSSMRGTAADVIRVGVRDLRLQGRLADPMLQRVLLIGDAPAAEINFELLRECQDRHRKAERERWAAQERAEDEKRRLDEEERLRSDAEEEARASAIVLAAMPEPVTADQVMVQAAMQMAADRAQEAAMPKVETAEQKVDREKKEKALAWLLEYQKKQADEKLEQERQVKEREQAEREIKAEMEKQARKEERARKKREGDRKRESEQEEQRSKADAEEKTRAAKIDVERRTKELREARQAEEERQREEERERKLVEEEMQREAEEERAKAEEQKRVAEEHRKRVEEERRQEEAEERLRAKERQLEEDDQRARQQERQALEEQRRAFAKAEDERLRRRQQEEADIKKQKHDEARRLAEEVRQRHEEEERLRKEAYEQERMLELQREKERARQAEEAHREAERRDAERLRREKEEERRQNRERDAVVDELIGGSGVNAARALKNRGAAESAAVVSKGKKPSPAASDSGSSGDEEVFDAAKFRLAKSKVAPASGSNLRAWAVSAATRKGDSSGEESDAELDWLEQRRRQKGEHPGPSGKACGALKAPALPSMGGDDSDSDGDVEPIFVRR